MLEFFNAMDTGEKVTFVIAVVGFLMSAMSWISTWWNGRKRLDVRVEDFDNYDCVSSGKKWAYLYITLLISNHSTNDISIYSMSLEGTESIICQLRRDLVGTRRSNLPTLDGDPAYVQYLESPDFPVNLAGLQCVRENIIFYLPLDYEYSRLREIVLHTSHGKVILDDEEQIARVRGLIEAEVQTQRDGKMSNQFGLESPTRPLQ